MLTPKQMTERLLATAHVRGEYLECPADRVWFALHDTYAPDVPVELYWPQDFRNPVVTSRFPGIPLRVALEDIARFCGVTMRVTDRGTIALGIPRHTERMQHAVVIEAPALSAWTAVQALHNLQQMQEELDRART